MKSYINLAIVVTRSYSQDLTLKCRTQIFCIDKEFILFTIITTKAVHPVKKDQFVNMLKWHKADQLER